MLCNFLEASTKRAVRSCNFNRHILSKHPDRILNEHDLIYIRQGEWQISQDGRDYDLTDGDVILLQGGHHHYGLVPCRSDVKTCFVHFSMHPNDSVEEKKERSDFFVFPMIIHCKDKHIVEHYFKRIIYSYWSEGSHARQKAAAYLDLLLYELSDIGEVKKLPSDSVVEDIKLQIKQQPGRFIGNEEFAKKHHCSVRTISSKFKNATGCSLHKWQMELKCRMADELMHFNPSITLKEVAATYGFYDEYHFSKCFKKIMGHSPKS